MKKYNRTSTTFLRWISVGFIFAAVLLAVFQLVQYSRIRTVYPPGLVVAGVPVGGLNQQQAAERVDRARSHVHHPQMAAVRFHPFRPTPLATHPGRHAQGQQGDRVQDPGGQRSEAEMRYVVHGAFVGPEP